MPYNTQVYTITWTSDDWLDPDGNALPVKIELSRDGGGTWETIVASTTNDGSYDWTVTGPGSANCIIRISDPAAPTVYDDTTVFAIDFYPTEPYVASVANGGPATWGPGGVGFGPGTYAPSYINTITPTGSAVAGGATAVITGSGFSASGNAVAFGSTALGWTSATIITETATQISVTIPAGAANTVGIRVTNALAQVATLTSCFVYYATPTSHVKQRIIDAIIYGLGQITENNGYNYTIRRIYDPPTGFTEMEEFPAVNVYDGEETCANANLGAHLQTGGNNAMLHNSFVITLDCVLTTTPNQATARQDRYKFLADVQKYFGKNYWIPNEYSEGTARCCFYQSSTPFGIESNRNDITGISIDFIVWYDQVLTNPTSRG